MKRLLDGFLWGFGFSFAVLLTFVTYTILGHAKVEQSYQKSLEKIGLESAISYKEALDVRLMKTDVVNNEVLLFTRMKNTGSSASNFGWSLRFNLYNLEGELIGYCNEDIPNLHSDESFINIRSTCTTEPYPIDSFHKATVAVLDR